MMSRNRSIIFLGDLIRAFVHLQPTDEATQHLIAELLGLERQSPAVARSVKVEPEVVLLVQSREEQSSSEGRVIPQELPQTSPIPTSAPVSYTSDWVPSTLEFFPGEAEAWSIDIVPLQPEREEELYNPPPLEPLFKPVWTRSILSAALSTTSGDGPLDVPSIVETLARGEYLQQLPKLPWPTLRRGVQLLVDKSDSMVPFAQDQVWLQNKIQEVVGIDKVQIIRYVSCPLRVAVKRPKKTWTAYRPPPPGTVVLLLTDLGIGRPMFSSNAANIVEWLDFAAKVRQASCPLVAFVPYGPSRWPRRLVDVMTLIQWDRGTTVATIRKLVGYAHEVAE